MAKNNKSSEKRKALLQATLCLVKSNGFHQAPMSKIAKMASVSPATIYIYFDSKQDLINKLYLELKKEFCDYAFQNYDTQMPIKSAFCLIWKNIASYKINKNKESSFLCQCDNTPMIDKDTILEGKSHLQPLLDLWTRGQDEGIIKNISAYILYAFTIYPISFLINSQGENEFTFTDSDLDKTFDIVWDSIRL